MSSGAPLCDLVTADSKRTLKCYVALKARFLTLCQSPSVASTYYKIRDRFASLFEYNLLALPANLPPTS